MDRFTIALIIQHILMLCIFFWCMLAISRITARKFEASSVYRKRQVATRSDQMGNSGDESAPPFPIEESLENTKNAQYFNFMRMQNIQVDKEFAMIRMNTRTAQVEYELVKQNKDGNLEIRSSEISPLHYTFDLPTGKFLRREEQKDDRFPAMWTMEDNNKVLGFSRLQRKGHTAKSTNDYLRVVLIDLTGTDAIIEKRVSLGQKYYVINSDSMCTESPEVLIPMTFGQWLKYENIPNYDNEGRSVILPHHYMKCVDKKRVVVYSPRV
ncbi:hypothetical protein DOLIC_00148 [Dolichomitus sp. PSUC_FEM 10030005]|nr:hypothetical protein [Dolichomitus sp. PSUC_FEM 10030005]